MKKTAHLAFLMNTDTLPDPIMDNNEDYSVVARGEHDHISACALVLAAMDIDYLQQDNLLLVPCEEAGLARQQLQAYLEENSNWPPPPNWTQQRHRQTPPPPTLMMIGALFLFFHITGPWHPGNPWFEAGAIDSAQILDHGQWWRLITALNLHADTMHVLGNCLIGGFIVHLLCITIGYGSGWLLLLLTGALANFINIVVRSGPHYSVGFSTAVFAAIGMFSGLQIKNDRHSSLRLLIPLGAGAGLLAFLGSAGKHTDLGAHLFGFFCGIIVGLLIILTNLITIADNGAIQRFLFCCALVLIFLCWWIADLHTPISLW